MRGHRRDTPHENLLSEHSLTYTAGVQVTSTRSGRAAPLPPDERRLAILQAILPVVRARGTDVTTRELAEAAQVAEGTLFRVFDDKEALLREALAAALNPADDIERLNQIDLSLPLEKRIAEAFRIGTARVEDMVLWMSVMHRLGRAAGGAWHRPRNPAAASDWVQRQWHVMTSIRVQLRRLLEPDADRLRQPLDTAAELFELTLLGMVAQASTQLRQGAGTGTPDPRVLADFFLDGVLAAAPH